MAPEVRPESLTESHFFEIRDKEGGWPLQEARYPC